MNTLKQGLVNTVKGFFIGIGAIIPGLSGGTVAIIAGVFENLLEATANIFKHFKRSMLIITPLAIGALIGVFTVSPLIELFSLNFPIISKWVFCLISAIAALTFAKKSIECSLKMTKLTAFLLGILLSNTINIYLTYYALSDISDNFFILILVGLPLSFALVLPAISFSYMLLYFGLYEKFLKAVNSFDIGFLIPLGIGIAAGTMLCSKGLLKAINKHPQETYCAIFGFVVCSIINILLK